VTALSASEVLRHERGVLSEAIARAFNLDDNGVMEKTVMVQGTDVCKVYYCGDFNASVPCLERGSER
jgi:hypothetical protein